jgi:hypothetical protein
LAVSWGGTKLNALTVSTDLVQTAVDTLDELFTLATIKFLLEEPAALSFIGAS